MRVKIEGEVSVERLFEAYQKACEAYGRVMPGFKREFNFEVRHSPMPPDGTLRIP